MTEEEVFGGKCKRKSCNRRKNNIKEGIRGAKDGKPADGKLQHVLRASLSDCGQQKQCAV